MVKTTLKKYLPEIAGTFIGAVGGFLYWKFVGCTSGTCMIKSVWYWSTIYGLLLGYVTGGLVGEIVIKLKKKKI